MTHAAPSAPLRPRVPPRGLAAILTPLVACVWLTACVLPLPPVNRDAAIPLTVEPTIDVDRYLGRWYEIARFPNSFEKGCYDVTATYSRRDDGLIGVVNACVTESGEKVAEGRAKTPDPDVPAKLKVSFFGPFFGDYWILDLAEDYSVSLVGEPRGRFLWILAREPELSAAERERALKTLGDLGYRTEALYFTPQSAADVPAP